MSTVSYPSGWIFEEPEPYRVSHFIWEFQELARIEVVKRLRDLGLEIKEGGA